MAKIGFNVIKDNYNNTSRSTQFFMWSDDGLKHPYNLIGFRFLDENNNILFIGNLLDDPNKKSYEMAVQWCCNKLANDKDYDEVELHFELSLKGAWIRKF